jgi:hypothetical protein
MPFESLKKNETLTKIKLLKNLSACFLATTHHPNRIHPIDSVRHGAVILMNETPERIEQDSSDESASYSTPASSGAASGRRQAYIVCISEKDSQEPNRFQKVLILVDPKTDLNFPTHAPRSRTPTRSCWPARTRVEHNNSNSAYA